MRHKLDRRVENLLRLRRHLPFFLGETVIKKFIDMRDGVEGNLLGEYFRACQIIHKDAAGLVEQLVHRRLAGPRHRLIGRHNNPLHAKPVMKRLQRDDKLGCRTIRIGDDVAATILAQHPIHRIGIHLRHDQRHVFIHAKGRGIVDDDTASLAGARRHVSGCAATGREQRDIGLAEIEFVERGDRQHLILTERDLAPGRP